MLTVIINHYLIINFLESLRTTLLCFKLIIFYCKTKKNTSLCLLNFQIKMIFDLIIYVQISISDQEHINEDYKKY